MTETTSLPQEMEVCDERIDVLTGELRSAIQWQRPCLLMVAYTSEFVRSDFTTLLENSLIDMEQRIVHVHVEDCLPSLEVFHRSENRIFFVDGFSAAWMQTKAFRSTINRYMEHFVRSSVRLVIWLTQKDAALLAQRAPELWNLRHQLIDLVESPKPEQILRNTLESAWQGMGEYGDQFEDTEARISLRESFLTELPRNSEATGTRANLLLTLGVLHWRKGEYEKADEILQEALQSAARMRDNWFEAECFNAIALVRSSMGRNDDAIDAYKQAIRLAPDQIFAWNNLGNLCLKIQRNDEAMIAFQKSLEHNDKDPIAWNGLGDVYSRIEYVDDAIAAYRKSIEAGPMLAHPWNGLGEMYARIGRSNEAVLAFEQAIKRNAHFIPAWVGLARLHAKQDRNRDAIKAYQQALLLDARNSSLWNDLGTVYFNATRYQDAVESFLKAIDLDRTFAWAYSNLGLAHAMYGRAKDSVALYLKSIELFTDALDKATTWNRLADAYRMLNDYGKAIKAYQQADALRTGFPIQDADASDAPQVDPVTEADAAPQTEASLPVESTEANPIGSRNVESESSYVTDGPNWMIHPASDVAVATERVVTHEVGRISLQMSLPLFSPVSISEAPDQPSTADASNARMWNEKGNMHFRVAAYEEAIAAYEKAIGFDPSLGWAYCNLGLTYLAMSRYAEAILLLQKSIELLKEDIDRAVAWNGLGNLYRRLNDYDNAMVAWQKADELDPQNAGAREAGESVYSEPNSRTVGMWSKLGDQFMKAGSYAEAANCYRKAVEVEPHNGLALSNLGLCLSHQSKYEEAIPFYLKSIELLHTDREKADAWNRLGNAYRKLNDYDNAMTAFQNAVKLNYEQTTLVTRARFSLLGNCYVE